jgi:hypothetical protein
MPRVKDSGVGIEFDERDIQIMAIRFTLEELTREAKNAESQAETCLLNKAPLRGYWLAYKDLCEKAIGAKMEEGENGS